MLSFREWVRRVDVVLIVGLYKTGTSLAVELCAQAGLVDPSRSTNPCERGYGVSMPRYLTHECAILRNLNQGWLKRPDTLSDIEPAARYISAWRLPVVLKDPLFLYTLPRWIAGCSSLKRRVGLLFVCRPERELLTAWEAAPFTRELLLNNRLAGHLDAFQEQMMWCRSNQVPFLRLSLTTLRRLKLKAEVSALPGGLT